MNHLNFSQFARWATLALLCLGIVLFGVNNVAWATPSQSPLNQTIPEPTEVPGAVQQTVAPGVNTTVTTGDGRWSAIITDDDLSVGGTLELKPVVAGTLPPAATGFAFLGRQLEITLFDANGNALTRPEFDNPIEICFNYTADDLAVVGDDPSRLVIQFYDTQLAPPAWVSLFTAVDTANSQACATVTHLTLFALTAASGDIVTLLEATGAETPASPAPISTTIWMLLGLFLSSVIAFVGVRHVTQRRL